jgi:hypothetical protein
MVDLRGRPRGPAIRASIAWLMVAGAGLVAAAPAFEPAPTLRASAILPRTLVQGRHHTVREEVPVVDYYEHFAVASDFGAMHAEGRTLLRTRLVEVDALARLSEVSKTEAFARAAGGAVIEVGKGVVSAVQDPVDTVKGIGGGLKRLGVNLGRKARRAASNVTADDKRPEGDARNTKDKALGAAGGAANAVFGINGAAREWARRLGVDPYTTNPVLHEALVDIGRIEAAAGIAVKLMAPIPAVVSSTARVGDLVWSADPEALRKENERRAGELGVSPEVASRYFANGNYTLTNQTRLLAALHAVKARGCADYLDAAAEAATEREALFFVESAEMLAGLHEAEPVSAILEDSRAMVAKTGARAVALLPFDRAHWTADLKASAEEIGGRARRELGARTLAVRLSGKATPAARSGFAAAGWTVKEGAVAGLRVPPV